MWKSRKLFIGMKNVWKNEDIGMVLTATQDDSVLFGTNSGVVLNALSQYIKTF